MKKYFGVGLVLGVIALIAGAPLSAAFGIVLIGPLFLGVILIALGAAFVEGAFRGR